MADPRFVETLRLRQNLEEAIARLLPRLRVLFVVGALLVAMSSAALASILLMRSSSLAPIGIFMALAGMFESGVGHLARGGGPNANPWLTIGALHLAAGVLTLVGGSLLPGWILVSLVGLCLLGAGANGLRLGFAMPEKYQTGVIVFAAAVTSVIALLLILQWGSNDPVLLGLLLSADMLVRGWSWIALGVVLIRRGP